MVGLEELVCKRDERPLFAPLTMTVNGGDCVEVLGPNGAGKTTLLRTIAGLHTQYDGVYDCANFIFQGHRIGLDELMTPLENLAWFGSLQGAKFNDQVMQDMLLKVGMAKLALTPCQRLSQGQQRRVAMAKWLLSSAKVWLLDEPYTSLDRAGQDLLNEVLAEHCGKGGVVMAATHVPLRVGKLRTLNVIPSEADN